MAFTTSMRAVIALLPFYFLSCLTAVSAQELTDSQIALVSTRLENSAERSWELGTRAQAILELNATRFSVLSHNSIPPPQRIPNDLRDSLEPVWEIARDVVGARGGGDDARPLMPDGSSADPASIGIAVLLANWTNLDGNANRYAEAARGQLRYLFSNQVPKTDKGAISHRSEQLQIWSDSVYMIPPFLAYYGVITENKTIVDEAFNQVKLYRELLRDDEAGVWKHSVLGNNTDPGLWATGNGWAAAGMLRVYGTIKNSRFEDEMDDQLDDLEDWVKEIHEAVYHKYFDSESLVRNYLNDNGTFYDAAATALLAATVYRAATVMDETEFIPFAERTRMTLFTPHGGPGADTNGTRFDNYEFFTPSGWLRPTVDPISVNQVLSDGQSPEAQAFVLMMHSAWRDWRDDGEQGIAGAAASMKFNLALGAGLAVATMFAWL